MRWRGREKVYCTNQPDLFFSFVYHACMYPSLDLSSVRGWNNHLLEYCTVIMYCIYTHLRSHGLFRMTKARLRGGSVFFFFQYLECALHNWWSVVGIDLERGLERWYGWMDREVKSNCG